MLLGFFSLAGVPDTPSRSQSVSKTGVNRGLAQLHKLRSYEVKTVAQAFLEIISLEITWFKVRSGAFFSRAEVTFFRWHNWILNILWMGIICFGCRIFASVLIGLIIFQPCFVSSSALFYLFRYPFSLFSGCL